MKKKILLILTVCLLLAATAAAGSKDVLASDSYVINGVSVPFAAPSSDGCIDKNNYLQIGHSYTVNGTTYTVEGSGCYAFADYAYTKIWGKAFSAYDTSDMLELNNSKSAPLTAANLATYVLAAAPGAVLRVDADSQWDSDDNQGHSIVIAAINQDGFVYYDGWNDATGNCKIQGLTSTTWSDFAALYGASSSYQYNYIKYLKSPGAVVENVSLPTVSGLQALAFNKKVRINWDSCDGADGYYIYAMNSDESLYKTYTTANAYCNFTNLTNGLKYSFKIRAYKNTSSGRNYGLYGDTVSAMPYDDTVQNLTAAASDSKIKISWDTVSGADGYYIYAMYGDGSLYKTYKTTKITCNFTNLQSDSVYQFKVRAYKLDSTGAKVYSTYSATVAAATPASTVTETPASAVAGLAALAFNQKIRVNWDAAAGAAGYQIYVTYADGSSYKSYSTVNTYCNFTNLVNGTQYVFYVCAYSKDAGGATVYGDYSNAVSAQPYDDTVQNLQTESFDSKIRISWDTVSGADGYYIYAMYADASLYKTYCTARTACNFTNLTNNKAYQFKVRAYKLDSKGTKIYSNYSSTVKAVPQA